MKNSIYTASFILLAMFVSGLTNAQSCCSKDKKATEDSKTSISQMIDSQYKLVNQDGINVELSKLIKDKVVVMNFVFTSCKTICPPMGANLIALKKELGVNAIDDLALISISIDPTTDTPERLKAWQNQFDSNEDNSWTMLTGEKSTIDQLLKDLKVFTPLIKEHAPIIIMGYGNENDWIRTNGLASPTVLSTKVNQYLNKKQADNISSADRGYFSDTELLDQNGDKFKFYTDLMKDKVVFINPFFSECPGTCPMMHKMMQEVQVHLGDRLGSSVVMLSISVDPINDTPAKLKDYAATYGAKPGWHFLTGSVKNVNTVLQKLGKQVENREAHDTIILIGNMKTKLWKKANGLADAASIIEVLETVINDTGETE